MEPGRIIQTTRWPAWLNAAVLLVASWIAIAALSLQVRPGAEAVAVVFPPWWSGCGVRQRRHYPDDGDPVAAGGAAG